MQFDKKRSMTYIYVIDKATEGKMVVNLRRLAPLKRKHKLYYDGLEVLVLEREELLPERTRLLIGHSGLLTSG